MFTFDINVLVYSLDRGDPVKHQQALDCLAQHVDNVLAPVILWQVACETVAWLRRGVSRKMLTAEQASLSIKSLTSGFQIATPLPATFDRALGLFERYSLSHWDSLLIAACIDAGITTIFSEDMGHESCYDSVTVLNPFSIS